MTLILGIRCTDGIVLGADGSATLGALGTYTARQQSVKKLRIVRDKIVFGLSGPVGLGQLLCAGVEGGAGGRIPARRILAAHRARDAERDRSATGGGVAGGSPKRHLLGYPGDPRGGTRGAAAVQPTGVAGNHHRTIPGVEPVSIRLGDGRMAHATARNLDIIVLHDKTRLGEFVNRD